MFGSITKYRAKLGVGVIVAEDGRKYRFKKDQIVNLNGKIVGHEVDFEISTVARPKDIVLMTGSPWGVFGSASNKPSSDSSQGRS